MVLILGNFDDSIKRLLRLGKYFIGGLEKDLYEFIKRVIEF